MTCSREALSSRCRSSSRRSGRERVSHTPNSGHGTELAAIVDTRALDRASDDPESQVRQRVALMGHPLPSPSPRRTRSMRRPSPEPGDYGRATATSLVMRRPVRGYDCVSRPRAVRCRPPFAMRRPRASIGVGCGHRRAAPVRETKTALKERATVRHEGPGLRDTGRRRSIS